MVSTGLKLKHTCKSYEDVIPGMIRDARKIAAKSLDYEIASLSNNDFRMETASSVSFRYGRGREEFKISPFATSQLCNKIGMPYNYFKKLAYSGSDRMQKLLRENINCLAAHYNGSFLLRTTDDKIRGVLTKSYQPFDTDELLDVFNAAFSKTGPIGSDSVVIRGHFQNEEFFHLRFTSPDTLHAIKDKDLSVGMSLTTSDVGMSSIRLRFFVYKQICTNGLCISYLDRYLFDQRHIGTSKDKVYKGLTAAFSNYPRLISMATDMIVKGADMSIADSAILAAADGVAGNRQRETIQKYLGIGEGDMAVLARLTTDNYEPTIWGYVNAITEFAQRYDVSRRLELESKAGELLRPQMFKYLVA